MAMPRPAFVLSTGAVVLALALLPVAFLLPVYPGESGWTGCTGAGHCHIAAGSPSQTLVQANGDRVVVVLGMFVVLPMVGWLGLRLRCKTGSRFGMLLGWSAAITVLLLSMVSALAIALLVVAVMMLVAAGTTLAAPG
jgi:hypothetical protein